MNRPKVLRRILSFSLSLATLLALAFISPAQPALAQGVCSPTNAPAIAFDSSALRPAYGRWNFVRTTLSGNTICKNVTFSLAAGEQAWVQITLTSTDSQAITPVAAVAISNSWQPGSTTLHHGPFVGTVSGPYNSITATGPGSFEVNTHGVGYGVYTVTFFFGATPGCTYQSHPSWFPSMVVAAPSKQPATGDYDHTIYPDSSFLGGDARLSPWQAQNDLNFGLGDAPNDPPGWVYMTPGAEPPLCTRGLFINNRVGIGNRLPFTVDGTAADEDDYADWYDFTLYPGSQAVINLWPTRYDYYGGGFEWEFWDVTTGSPPPGSPPVCSGSTYDPLETVFTVQGCGPLVGYAPAGPGSGSAVAAGGNQTFRLHIRSDGFTRYSVTIERLANPVPKGFAGCSGPLTFGCGGVPPL